MVGSFKELESFFHCHVYPICRREEGSSGKKQSGADCLGKQDLCASPRCCASNQPSPASFPQRRAVSRAVPLVLNQESSGKPLMESVEYHQCHAFFFFVLIMLTHILDQGQVK